MRRLLVSSLLLSCGAFTSQAALLLSPGDAILGGRHDGTTALVQGNVGGNPGNTWPAAEPPSDLINGVYGGGGEKFLLFSPGENAGVIITPSAGPTIVTSMTMWNANDSEGRRPATYELLRTNTPIVDGGPGTNYAISDFTLISSGGTGLPTGDNTVTTPIGSAPFSTGLRNTVTFPNTNAYTSYMLYFPTLNGEPLFQLSEVAFEGVIIPEPGSASLLALSIGVFLFRRKR